MRAIHCVHVPILRIKKTSADFGYKVKAFKDWDISDFDFAHAESLADQPLRRDHIPFYGFNKVPEGEYRLQFSKCQPTSNLTDVL